MPDQHPATLRLFRMPPDADWAGTVVRLDEALRFSLKAARPG
ncbi:hypothetical protein QN374_05775 [Herbaspirillum sp. RTI4]|nr:hypothetical protein [Herbaspirillum sp. RTI4]MEA9981343.1 hypothetical protein [Herbaspirillum sp. RTI4]